MKKAWYPSLMLNPDPTGKIQSVTVSENQASYMRLIHIQEVFPTQQWSRAAY